LLKEAWKPTHTLAWVLEVLKTMMQEISIDSALEAEIASQYRTNKVWLAVYALDAANPPNCRIFSTRRPRYASPSLMN